MIALLKMAPKIGGAAIEQVIDDLVLLREKPLDLLIIDNMLAQDIGHLHRRRRVVIRHRYHLPRGCRD